MNKVLHDSKIFLKRNSSTILSYAGVVGVVATTVMAVKATPKALRLLEEAREEKGENLTGLETIKTVATTYAPSVITGIATIGCILGANVLNKRHQAALTSAYALLDNSYKEFKKKVDELYGEEAGTNIRGAIAKDKYGDQEFEFAEGTRLYYDFYSSQYFEASPTLVQRAEYEVNRLNISEGSAYLNDWYISLGLEPFDSEWIFGWTPDINNERYWQKWIDFKHEKVELDDGLECIIISFMQDPVIDFADYV